MMKFVFDIPFTAATPLGPVVANGTNISTIIGSFQGSIQTFDDALARQGLMLGKLAGKTNRTIQPLKDAVIHKGKKFLEKTKNAVNKVKEFGKKVKKRVKKQIGKTNTVWDNIKATDTFYIGTKIPRSFEITIGKEKFWVHPNATKHMCEYIEKRQYHGMPINSQTLLTSFKTALKAANIKGFKYDEIFTIGCWEFKIGMAKKEGFLQSIYHAKFDPKGLN